MNNKFLKSVPYIFYILISVLVLYILLKPAVSYDIVFEIPDTSFSDETVDVTVSGEVENPGTYRVNKGMTYYDAVSMAGKVTNDAYISELDMSEVITSSCEIRLLSLSGMAIVTRKDYFIGSDADSHKLNINTASKEQLTLLKGIGSTISERIIEYRQNNGYFKTISDILNVRGIGKGTYYKIKDYITVGEG